MFKENSAHIQESLLDSTYWMTPGIRAKLEKSWAPVFYEHVFCNIDEAPFSVLYSHTGRPGFPINIMLSLEYIKSMKNYSDDELIDAFNFNYLVNYAIGIRTLGELNLAERTLYNFRSRLYKYITEHPTEEDIIFEQFLSLTKGFSKSVSITTAEQRMDTTMFMSNIKRSSRLALTFDVLHALVKAIPEAYCSSALAEVLNPAFKTDITFRTKPSESATKLNILLSLCLEAKTILENIPGTNATRVLRIAERFLSEQTQRDTTSLDIKGKSSKQITSGSLQSIHDEDATYRKKGKTGQSGYVLGLAETCSEENPFQLITDYRVDKNITSDIDIIKNRLPQIRENTGCTDMYVDGGFHSNGVIEVAKDNGIEVHFTNLNGTSPRKKLPVDEYAIDEITKKITQCPSGFQPTQSGITKDQTIAHYPFETCDKCELRDQCHTKRQKKDYVVRISLKALKTAKERQTVIECRKENTSKRAAIEGTNSALKRSQGLDKMAVRGILKCSTVSGIMVTAQNIKRFTRHMLALTKKLKTQIQCISPSNLQSEMAIV
jgi:hypothetical protein